MLIFLRGIKSLLLRAIPVKTSQSIALRCINLMRILVPLTNASFVFKFLISKTMQLTFYTNLFGGIPLIVKELRNSTGLVIDVIDIIINNFIVTMICSLFTRNLNKYIGNNQSTIIILGAKITRVQYII